MQDFNKLDVWHRPHSMTLGLIPQNEIIPTRGIVRFEQPNPALRKLYRRKQR